MRRLRAMACLVAALASVPAFASEPRHGKKGDELEDRIPAVSGALFLKAGRHEITPIFDLSLADAFRQKLMVGLAYSYHFSEVWAATGRFSYTVLSHGAGAAKVCPTPEQCGAPTPAELDTLPGNLKLQADLAVEFSPIYGKVSFIAEKVLHFDVYATVGLGLTGYGLTKDGVDKSGMSPSVVMGVGQRYFLDSWLAVRLELLDSLYFQPTGKVASQLSNQMMFTVGFSFFFPTTFTYKPVAEETK